MVNVDRCYDDTCATMIEYMWEEARDKMEESQGSFEGYKVNCITIMVACMPVIFKVIV